MGESKELLSRYEFPEKFPRAPVVFMFQPTGYEIVRGDRLKEWEILLKELVGLEVDASMLAGTATVSCCPFADD